MSVNISPMVVVKPFGIRANKIIAQPIISFYIGTTRNLLCFKRRNVMYNVARSINLVHVKMNLKGHGGSLSTTTMTRTIYMNVNLSMYCFARSHRATPFTSVV